MLWSKPHNAVVGKEGKNFSDQIYAARRADAFGKLPKPMARTPNKT
jgi:hypothetical protein